MESASCGPWALPSTAEDRTLPLRSPTCSGHRKLYAPRRGRYPLRGHNNVQGASDFGSMPDSFPGYQKVEDPEICRKFEQKWGTPLSPEPGFDNHEMIDAISQGKVRALYVIGEDLSPPMPMGPGA